MAKIYIAGKITGTTDYMSRFADAEKNLNLSTFYEAVNPARINGDLPPSTTYDEYIHLGLELLRECEAIFMLLGWEDSPGARLEHQYAETLGKTIYYEKNFEVNSI